MAGSGTEAYGRALTRPELLTSRPPLRPPLSAPPPAGAPKQVPERLFFCKVTAPVSAKALPQRSVAVVFMLIEVSARMLPTKIVFVSMVAELRTFQYTPAPEPVLMTCTTELGDVSSVLGI